MAIDPEKLMKKTKPEMVAAMQEEIAELDQRRQNQIRNQVGTINRVMQGHSYDEEMERLHAELAETQRRLESALMEIRRLKRSGGTARLYDLGRGVG